MSAGWLYGYPGPSSPRRPVRACSLVLIGRRGGKDRGAAVVAAYVSGLVDWSGVLAKGERGIVLCIGADTKQAAVQRRYIEGVFDASPMLSSLVASKTAHGIELLNSISIEVRAANFRRLRGVTCVAVIATEAAFWLNETSANPDTEILNAVRPSLATTGGPLLIITTPYAQRGEVYTIYRRHFGARAILLCLSRKGRVASSTRRSAKELSKGRWSVIPRWPAPNIWQCLGKTLKLLSHAKSPTKSKTPLVGMRSDPGHRKRARE